MSNVVYIPSPGCFNGGVEVKTVDETSPTIVIPATEFPCKETLFMIFRVFVIDSSDGRFNHIDVDVTAIVAELPDISITCQRGCENGTEVNLSIDQMVKNTAYQVLICPRDIFSNVTLGTMFDNRMTINYYNC